MNTAQIYIVGKAVLEDLSQTNIIALLQALLNGLKNQIKEPQVQHVEQISTARSEIYEVLTNSQANTFPKTWNPTLEELEVYDLLGTRMLAKVETILSRNEITLDLARDQLQILLDPLSAIQQNLTNILNGLEHFELTGDDLEPGQGEVSVLIPRSLFEDNLEGLAIEFNDLNNLMLVMTEIATHSRESPKLRQMSTTDPWVLIYAAPPPLFCSF